MSDLSKLDTAPDAVTERILDAGFDAFMKTEAIGNAGPLSVKLHAAYLAMRHLDPYVKELRLAQVHGVKEQNEL